MPAELHREAYSTISRAVRIETTLGRMVDEGVETGGYLLGEERDGLLHLAGATCEPDEQTSTSVKLSDEPPDAIGHWHSHPDGCGLELSPADWRHAVSRAQHLRTVTLVVGRNDGRLLGRGYDMQLEDGVVVAYPLALTERTDDPWL